jgi:hypothetical protein
MAMLVARNLFILTLSLGACNAVKRSLRSNLNHVSDDAAYNPYEPTAEGIDQYDMVDQKETETNTRELKPGHTMQWGNVVAIVRPRPQYKPLNQPTNVSRPRPQYKPSNRPTQKPAMPVPAVSSGEKWSPNSDYTICSNDEKYVSDSRFVYESLEMCCMNIFGASTCPYEDVFTAVNGDGPTAAEPDAAETPQPTA